MSAFHRVDDVRAMPARRFIDFAIRLYAYKGVIRALVENEQAREQEGNLPASVRRQAAPSGANDITRNRTVESDLGTLRTDPAFAGMIETRVTDG